MDYLIIIPQVFVDQVAWGQMMSHTKEFNNKWQDVQNQ